MRPLLSECQLLQPRSLPEALRMLHEAWPAIPVAGCTDLYVAMNAGTLGGGRFVDIWGLDELRPIRVVGDVLTIGALATWSQIARSASVRKRLPILVEAARQIGGVQIQNRGTIGGNVANASPAGDGLPVLAVADAVVVVASEAHERRIPFGSFYTGYRKTALLPGELIVAIEIPPVAGRQWFRKVGTRAAQAISKVVVAGVRGATPRLAFGSVAPTVIRVPRTEQHLAAGGSLADAKKILQSEITPIDDVRSTAAYRRAVCANLLERFWIETSASAPGAR